MFYQVGDQVFKNKFMAADYAYRYNLAVHFNLHEAEFDRADWSKEPSQTWDQLLDIRAHQIASKNKPIVLNFSGGTDSYTIYKVFERNNIHIDIIYVRRRPECPADGITHEILDFVHNKLYDKTTRVVIREDSADMYDKIYTSEDWAYEKTVRPAFGYGFTGDFVAQEYLSKYLGTDDFINIIGFEKPRLYFDSTGVYSYQEDENYCRPMSCPHVDCFYLNPELPELHIKQSYMMLNYIKSTNPDKTNTSQLIRYNKMHVAKVFDWHEYSINACGRFGDMTHSGIIHSITHSTTFYIPKDGIIRGDEYNGLDNAWFAQLYGSKAFANYTKGVLNIANDNAGKYLMQDKNNFLSLKQFKSKPYKLTF